MTDKKCCIENCKSSSTRKEDIGVTYHKFPNDVALCDLWLKFTRQKVSCNDIVLFVCSRHFCKNDYQKYQTSKHILKSEAVPSIFPWSNCNIMDDDNIVNSLSEVKVKTEPGEISLNSSKDSEPENLEAIKKFIEEQERIIAEHTKNIHIKTESIEQSATNIVSDVNQSPEIKCEDEEDSKTKLNKEEKEVSKKNLSEALAAASSVIDLILNESEAVIENKDDKNECEKIIQEGDKSNNSMTLSVGSEVEARDFGDYWHPAKIIEVDYDEMEVLVHYDDISKRHDEWISVHSSRLRPYVKKPDEPKLKETEIQCNPVKVEVKTEEKPKLLFVVGERCLARWRDSRRFMATVTFDFGNGQYEIIFDDGFRWRCSSSRLYKLKDNDERKNISLSVDKSIPSPCSSTSPHGLTHVPSTNVPPSANLSQIPIYHRHLFDPTRDYLGSKSERREMKRKLNIKEIFNIGQKQRKPARTEASYKKAREKTATSYSKLTKTKSNYREVKIKKEIPDAVASIIGTVADSKSAKDIVKVEEDNDYPDGPDYSDTDSDNGDSLAALREMKPDLDPAELETKLEQFEKEDNSQHEAVIGKIKEVITKLEDSLHKSVNNSPSLIEIKNEVEEPSKIDVTDSNTEFQDMENSVYLNTDEMDSMENDETDVLETIQGDVKDADIKLPEAVEIKSMVSAEVIETEAAVSIPVEVNPKVKKNISKIKKSKKFRLLQEKKVKKQVEKVKSELEEMKRQVEEMKKQMLMKTVGFTQTPQSAVMPESFLLPGEWCCKWVNGQPVGTVSEVPIGERFLAGHKTALPRRSVQVEDKRLPPGWTKHMVRRSLGNSAGTWNVILVSADKRKLHTKTEVRNYLESHPDDSLKPYEHALFDFGIHLKLARRMGWVIDTPDGSVPAQYQSDMGTDVLHPSPILHRKTSGLKRKVVKMKDKRRIKRMVPRVFNTESVGGTTLSEAKHSIYPTHSNADDGFVYVGSLKVQIVDSLLSCPAEGCFKNFRNSTLIKMHIKHYHRELRKMLGATPKVLDLAYARTKPKDKNIRRSKHKNIKTKMSKYLKRDESKHSKAHVEELKAGLSPMKTDIVRKRSLESPMMKSFGQGKPVKRPKVLLPVRKPDPAEESTDTATEEFTDIDQKYSSIDGYDPTEGLDFEAAISTHTVPKHFKEKKEKRKRTFAIIDKRPTSEEDEWGGNNSDFDTMSSYARSCSPDSKTMENKAEGLMHTASSESATEDHKESDMYMYNESGERIKIVQMKREEIINCHCGIREEDGLMVQCELCLCWQHALCHNIQKESEVPEKYTCSICLNPRRGRKSQRFLHDQDRMYEGLLPGAKPSESLRRSHELSANLFRIQDALHALRVKYYVATKKNHPKLYLWAKDWENGESLTQENLIADYSDLNIMMGDIEKENLPLKPGDMRGAMLSEDLDGDRLSQKDIGSQALLSGLLSSPGGTSLDLPISTSELERFAKSVQEQEVRMRVPQPEAAIENGACRERLLRHVQRCQALLDARLDSIEAQVAELESQDPSFEDDETADYFPRTKQTIQMLMRDLETMEELGVIT